MKTLHAWVILLVFALVLPLAPVGAFDEGIDYKPIVPPQPTASADKIEVIELFWYGCPHCYNFEPHINRWAENKPADVEFIRIPAVFNERWALHARAFYTAEALGVLPRLHHAIFEAMHRHKRPLDTERALMALFAEHGVSNEDFQNAFNSFGVQSKVRRAAVLSQRYGISGVPAMVVNGKYQSDGPMAGSHANLVKVVEHLVEKERKAAR